MSEAIRMKLRERYQSAYMNCARADNLKAFISTYVHLNGAFNKFVFLFF